jgi:hypothetical protein
MACDSAPKFHPGLLAADKALEGLLLHLLQLFSFNLQLSDAFSSSASPNFSHQIAHRAPNQRKLLCHNDFRGIRGKPDADRV